MPTMDDRAIEEYAAFACHLADLAGRTILPYFRVRLAVENKAGGGYDPVTLADSCSGAGDPRRDSPRPSRNI